MFYLSPSLYVTWNHCLILDGVSSSSLSPFAYEDRRIFAGNPALKQVTLGCDLYLNQYLKASQNMKMDIIHPILKVKSPPLFSCFLFLYVEIADSSLIVVPVPEIQET